jgi:predicted RNase H-like nuclease
MATEDPRVFATLLEVLDYKPAYQVIALFSAVGLADVPVAGGRKCDRNARQLLGWPRSGSIGSPPARPTLGCTNYKEAAEANGGHLSPISWQLLSRVAEVDRDLAPYWQRTVFEVHPELTCYQLNDDCSLQFPKHTAVGQEERRSLLVRRLPGVERIIDVRLRKVRAAHLLDAAACLWTARRIAARAVSRIPEVPEWDSQGLRMEIVR